MSIAPRRGDGCPFGEDAPKRAIRATSASSLFARRSCRSGRCTSRRHRIPHCSRRRYCTSAGSTGCAGCSGGTAGKRGHPHTRASRSAQVPRRWRLGTAALAGNPSLPHTVQAEVVGRHRGSGIPGCTRSPSDSPHRCDRSGPRSEAARSPGQPPVLTAAIPCDRAAPWHRPRARRRRHRSAS